MKKNGRCPKGEYYCYTDKKCKPIPTGFMVDPEGMLRKENGASIDEGARIPKKPGQPNKSDKHSDLYTDEDPKGTIHGLGFKDVQTAKQSVSKIRNSGRSHAHKIQAAIAMEQRARVAGKTSEAAVYRKFINSMKKKTKSMNEEGLRDWFGKSKSKDGKGGWVNVVTGGTCASDEPGEGTPKCVSSAKRASMTPAERRSAARRKKTADPGQQQKTGAAKPTYVSTDSPKKKTRKEEINLSDYFELVNDMVLTHKAGKNSENNLMEKNNCNHTKEGTNCPCHGKKRCPVVLESKDHEYSMVRSELSTIINAAKRLKSKMAKGEGNVEAWVQSKITKAADYLDSAADYVDSGEMNEESDKKGKGSGTKDACYHKVKSRYSVWPSAYASGALVKCRKVGAANWGNKSESITIDDINGNPSFEVTDLIQADSLKSTKSVIDKILDEAGKKCWPGYEKKGTQTLFGKKYNRCVKKEEVENLDEAVRIPTQVGNIILVTLNWKGKYYAMKIFFPQIKLPTRKEINDELQKVYPGSIVVHHTVSEIQPGQPLVQPVGPQGRSFASPGPSKKYVKPYGEQIEYEEVKEDWQSVNRKDKTAGLSQKAVDAYRRENPGSKLQTAVTEKNPTGKRASRRKSFCSRMKGMKSKLTSAKTARDPDSNINKALRRWNCN